MVGSWALAALNFSMIVSIPAGAQSDQGHDTSPGGSAG